MCQGWLVQVGTPGPALEQADRGWLSSAHFHSSSLSSSRQLSLSSLYARQAEASHTSQAALSASWRVLLSDWLTSLRSCPVIGLIVDDLRPCSCTEICTNFAALGSVTDFFPLPTPSSASFTSHVLTPFKMACNPTIMMIQRDWTAAFS